MKKAAVVVVKKHLQLKRVFYLSANLQIYLLLFCLKTRFLFKIVEGCGF